MTKAPESAIFWASFLKEEAGEKSPAEKAIIRRIMMASFRVCPLNFFTFIKSENMTVTVAPAFLICEEWDPDLKTLNIRQFLEDNY